MEAIADADCDLRIAATQRDYWIDWARKLDRLGYEPVLVPVVVNCQEHPTQPQVRHRARREGPIRLLAATYHEVGGPAGGTGLTLLFDRPVHVKESFENKPLELFHLERNSSIIPAKQVYNAPPVAIIESSDCAMFLPLEKKDTKLSLLSYRLVLKPDALVASTEISTAGRSLTEWKHAASE